MRPSALTAALNGMLALLVGQTCFEDCAKVMVMARLAKASARNRRIGRSWNEKAPHSIRVVPWGRATGRTARDGWVRGVRPRAAPPPHRRAAPGRRRAGTAAQTARDTADRASAGRRC